mmetsp:Transcript_96609/g.171796  ORF Transcript_96609/g.171796 Transcript_96609/m.171796 type:complete len:1541 (+) Transcript_96609:113-4735(+)|eukprot:CAMPEP_0197684050 /NCGR_PEP_ID=MMETSP1338-20131121/98886_1 /TAXON_ID=43686 ORGANISM="Pelagodinium beii, Strain RCC1491" /NCGR_SAMPLE_ID=MMETSP1338 /ASSEMBLY_ACC=CAM_ASM_000754 /LENGTH=1540 /DNA_ID=CAMNT_0043265711 /DNA_START=21 /DNA_END=4643 /DNA_ORIENTATION=-
MRLPRRNTDTTPKAKSGKQTDYNWDILSRDDIYRQRVLGTDSGAGDFIVVDDKRKLTVLSMLIYCLCILAAMNFVWSSGQIQTQYKVNAAVQDWLKTQPYDMAPLPRTFEDVDSLEDMRMWLQYGLPSALQPVQDSTFPLWSIRFTHRKIQEVNNTALRFADLAPFTWKDKFGISSTSESADGDDTADYGAFRVWQFNQDDIAKVNATELSLTWCVKERAVCKGRLIESTHAPASLSRDQAISRCISRCEHMEVSGKLCHCWTYRNHECHFFTHDEDQLTTAPQSCGKHWTRYQSSASLLYPQLGSEVLGSDAYFPLMTRFSFSEDGGYRKTPGFILKLEHWSRDQILQAHQNQVKSAETKTIGEISELRNLTSPPALLTFQNLASNQVRDWIAGGLIGPTTASLVVDYSSWNPYSEVFCWVQVLFEVSASGRVTPDLKVESIVVTKDDMQQSSGFLWSGFGLWDGLYLALVVYYMVNEIWEFALAGTKYFASGWQILNVSLIMLHLCTVGLRFQYHFASSFTESLASGDGFQPDLTLFEKQVTTRIQYKSAASLMILLLWFSLVHYLSDIVPRIGVLTDTLGKSITPVFFLVIIIAAVFMAFVIWSNLMFGKLIVELKDLVSTSRACIEMMFGKMEVAQSLRAEYPYSGFLFYMSFMVFFSFILQYLSRAIVLLSFDDASAGYEKRRIEEETRRAAESGRSSDPMLQAWNFIDYRFRGLLMSANGGQKEVQMPGYGLNREFTGSKWSIIVFAFFCAVYSLMAMEILVPETSYQMTSSVISALTSPTFEAQSNLGGFSDYDRNFYTIQSKQDVMAWMSQALPKALFYSSPGTFGDGENDLKNYSASKGYNQIVINDWNLVIGQTPIRLSFKYNSMESVESTSASAYLAIPQVIRSEESATTREQILNSPTGGLLKKYCANFSQAYNARVDEPNGFPCMLSVDQAKTTQTLMDMALKGIVSNQTKEVAIEFVSYNGNVDLFLYTAVVFEFNPSGVFEKRIDSEAIRMPSRGLLMMSLEALVTAFSVAYLALSLRGAYRAVLNLNRKLQSGKLLLRFILTVKVLFFHICGNPFNFLELLSCVMTLVLMFLWYGIVFNDLAQEFYFPETPAWTKSQCEKTGICEDSDVIMRFWQQKTEMRFFAQACTVNTILLFFRSLREMDNFRHPRVIFNTLIRGAADIAWFMVVMLVLLMAYVCMGHTLFGTFMKDFSTMPYAFVTNFQMFLGTFRNTEAMRQAGDWTYFSYWISYMVLFRFVLLNMFFAIIAKHFTAEDTALEKQLEQQESQGQQGQAFSVSALTSQAMKDMRSMTSARPWRSNKAASAPQSEESDLIVESVEAAENVGADDDGGEGEQAQTPPRGDSAKKDLLQSAGILPLEAQEMSVDEIVAKVDGNAIKLADTWQYLPDAMKEWATGTSKELCTFIEEQRIERSKEEKKKAYDLDPFMQKADDWIKDRQMEKGRMAEKVKSNLESEELRSLKEIHQDQESLAWYIMKREAELKKLEQAKALKEDRFFKLVNAAQSLISSEKAEKDGDALALLPPDT